MKKKSNYLQIDEIGKRFLTVDVVVIPVHFSSFLLLLSAEEELKYTHRLNLHSYEYEPGVRAGVLAKLLGKDKGNLVDCYGTHTEGYVESKKCWKKKRSSYSVKPEKINLEEYKNLLLKKLKDTLEIAGFNMNDVRQEKLLLSEHA
jgi:hypothetical protein